MKRFLSFQALLPVLISFGLVIFCSYSSFGQINCSGAYTLTPLTTCVNNISSHDGNIQNANSTTVQAGACGGATATTTYGVWYKFVATSSNAAITVPSFGTNLTAATTYIEVLSGACASSGMISIACQNISTALNLTTLTVGVTYYIRVYVTSNPTGNPANKWNFTICLQSSPNDDCISSTSLTSNANCTTTAGSLLRSTATTGLPAGCEAAGTHYDVWYSFVAVSSTQTATISNREGNFTNPEIQLYSGACGALTSIACGTTSLTANGLTIGNTYRVRVSNIGSSPATNGGFDICVTHPTPPANDDCAGSILLTSGVSCTNTTGNMFLASSSAIAIAPCTGPVVYDVWYRFVAQSTTPTITLSSVGSDINTPRLQLLSGTCAGLSSLFCGTTSIAATGLTIGNTYYIRAYASAGAAPASAANAGFDICVTDPPPPPPTNDECASAITLPLGGTCSNVVGTVVGATASSTPVAPCTGPLGYDVWYKFNAVNTIANISLSGTGTNFTNERLQLFSGNCTGLTSIFCGTTSIAATGLTAGSTYYLRVYSTSASAPLTNGGFNICVSTTNPPPRFGNSYVNISKKAGGGVVQPGDTLEIRMTINHTSGTMYGLRYVDNLPNHTAMLTGTGDSIRVITNEGLTFRKYTLAAGDDAATYKAAPAAGEYNIRLNLGYGSFPPGTVVNNTATESASATGRMTASTDRPRGGGGILFATSFRVVVTGSVGDTIRLNPGMFIYQTSAGGPDNILTAIPYEILISNPMSLCANATGVNNAAESGGTFGSGTTLNRSSNLSFPIPAYTYMGNVAAGVDVGDGRYAIVKNISPRGGTMKNADRRPNCTNALPSQLSCEYRMFNGHWDIDGDHTGTNDAIGNAPLASNLSGGYMLMVNADYVASETYRQTLTNLCPNTYYEFSAWIRNICSNCGNDSTGSQFAGTVTAPAAGYPGVLPNLTFALDDLDRYNTGEIAYNNVNSNSGGWVKKGFVFITGPSQTSATFSIRNNAQGGGGNDWVMDDVSIATCLPSMSYSPSLAPNVCQGSTLTINDTIRSYFNNYTHYMWQKSMNNGSSWSNVTAPTSVTLGPPVNGEYEFITSYTIPQANTTMADSGTLYRVLVATASANLGNTSCQVTDGISIINLTVLDDCEPILTVELLSFNGKLIDNKSHLSWSTSPEDSPLTFIIERSTDGRNFSVAGEVSAYNNADNINHYSFTDPQLFSDRIWYRVVMKTSNNKKKYSSIIQLKSDLPDFDLSNIINPFSNSLAFNITIGGSSAVSIELIDMAGKTVLSNKQMIYTGTNSINLANTQRLASGIYTLRIANKDRFITKRVIKKN
ncbi:MAG TPA: T9SS type A sorting domain-containing protein [Chitinophagaceae bacterium]|nr:T9SS type A sorting domain-containing protein [Chitinophagaceae bacterium]